MIYRNKLCLFILLFITTIFYTFVFTLSLKVNAEPVQHSVAPVCSETYYYSSSGYRQSREGRTGFYVPVQAGITYYSSRSFGFSTSLYPSKVDIVSMPYTPSEDGYLYWLNYNQAVCVADSGVWYETDDSGGEDPDNPGGEDPDNPGGEDPDNPGGEDPDNPGGEDPDNPGGDVSVDTSQLEAILTDLQKDVNDNMYEVRTLLAICAALLVLVVFLCRRSK